MARPRTLRAARISSQEGFGLVEVLVSALIVVVISLAVLGSLDTASRASGTSKAKATAANLAQQDQDRLQSMRPIDLIGLNKTVDSPPIQVGDRTLIYKVQSQGDYVLNPGSSSGCTNDQRDEYLRIVSTVTPPGTRTRPVRIESLIAPPLDVAPGQGSAVLKLTRADGVTPVKNQLVKLVGPRTSQQMTGEEGCAYFANQPVGSYSFQFSTPGWVDPSGDNAISLPVGVTSDGVASLDGQYDQAGKVENVTFITAVGATYIVSRAEKLVMSNPGVQRDGGTRSVATTLVGGTSTATLPNLFPFTSAYGVYAGGQCGRELPPALAATVNAGGGTASLLVAPGQTYSGRYVLEPALNPTVRYGGAVPPGPRVANVLVRSTDPLCPTAVSVPTQTNGLLADPGFPYGTYTVCAEYEYAVGQWRKSPTSTAKTNDQAGGLNFFVDIANSSTANGRCAT